MVDEPTGRGSVQPPIFEDAQKTNDDASKKQKLWMYGIVGVGGAAALFAVLMGHGNNPAVGNSSDGSGNSAMAINTDSMSAQSLADSNYRAKSENDIESLQNQMKGTNNTAAELAKLEQQVQALQAAKASGQLPAGVAGSPRDAEIAALKAQIAQYRNNGGIERGTKGSRGLLAGRPGPITVSGPLPQNIPTGSPLSGVPGNGGSSSIKIDSYTAAAGGKLAERGNLIFADSANYLPPNSIATATVIVGADAQAGVRTQAEPIPVVLRITSNARSVAHEGKLLQTQVTGCLVNGAAYADLSSEKVFVKLQKMTCNDDRGGVSISEVKGFVAFAGKAGVRGRVVSREGAFVVKSFLAGLVGGIGKLGQNVAQSSLYNTYGTNGTKPAIDLSTIGIGAGGSGVGQGSDAVSKYLIERAEQYQPVVEMPTGVSVEVVFLDGGYVR